MSEAAELWLEPDDTPMPAVLIPEKPPTFEEFVASAGKTADALFAAGLEEAPVPEHRLGMLQSLVNKYAGDPTSLDTMNSAQREDFAPLEMQTVRNVLDRFGQEVVTDAVKLRQLAVNKLVIAADDLDPKVSLRAVEMIGKMADVKLFSEQTEITITHRSTPELVDSVREKIRALMPDSDGVYRPEGTDELAGLSKSLPLRAAKEKPIIDVQADLAAIMDKK